MESYKLHNYRYESAETLRRDEVKPEFVSIKRQLVSGNSIFHVYDSIDRFTPSDWYIKIIQGIA